MLDPCLRIDPASFGAPPISSSMDKRAIRFELERRACQSLREVLQMKLQQRRTREQLVSQGIMPPLKSPAAFHEQRRSLERARTEDYLKRKIRSRPERAELVRMHILEETSAEPCLQAKQLQLKRARLADDLNDKLSHRPGPMELIHKNILPVHSSLKQAIIETDFPKVAGESSSFEEDSSDALSPDQLIGQDSPLGAGPLPSPTDTLGGNSNPSPTQFLNQVPPLPPPPPPLPPVSGPTQALKLTNGTASLAAQRTPPAQTKSHSKSSADRPPQRPKKAKDTKPKVKKLKYHQYIPPDQKAEREPPPQLDSSYAKILQQQQLFLQLQIINQQQQHYNYHTILPAPPKLSDQQQPPSATPASSTGPTPSSTPSSQSAPNRPNVPPAGGAKPASLPPNLDEMKVAELKAELKMRSLPVSGTKNDLIERLRNYQELNGGSTPAPPAGGAPWPGAVSSRTYLSHKQQQQKPSSSALHRAAESGVRVTGVPFASTAPQHAMHFGSPGSSPPPSPVPSERSAAAMSPDDASYSGDTFGEMVSSPLTQLSLQPSPQPPVTIKEETPSTPSSCHFPCLALRPAPPLDKDRMLQEKDKQIEELTRMLRQKQRLVETLRCQLEMGKRGGGGGVGGGGGGEAAVLLRVKEEPPDLPIVSSSPCPVRAPPPPPPPPLPAALGEVAVKEEASDPDEVAPEAAPAESRRPDRAAPERVRPQVKPERVILPSQRRLEELRRQQTALRIGELQAAQQQALQQLLLKQQQQQNRQNQLQNLQNLQRRSQQRKKKSHKQQLKQQQQQQLLLKQTQQQIQTKQSQQSQQQLLIQLKQQQQSQQQQQQQQLIQLKLQQQPQSKQQQVLQTKQEMHLQQPEQRQLLQSQQISQVFLNQQTGSSSSFPLDLLKAHSTPTLVTDSNGNHFLIALTNHTTENQGSDAPQGKPNNHIELQRLPSPPTKLPSQSPPLPLSTDTKSKPRSTTSGLGKQPTRKGQKAGLRVSTNNSQGVALSFSAPPNLQPFFLDEDSAPSGDVPPSPALKEECSDLDQHALFSPASPDAIKTCPSSPDDKEHGSTQHMDDLFDILIQTGEISATFKPAPDPSLAHLRANTPASSPPSSPLQLHLPPPSPPDPENSPPRTPTEDEHQAPPTTDPEGLSCPGSGRLEDFLESTTGKPLLGVEPGCPLTLIDDLHSQMLSTPSILDHPSSPSPMDTYELGYHPNPPNLDFGEQALDSMDWLDITMGGGGSDAPSLAPLGPPSVFSTDFLDGSDLQLHWDSCL
ncbi:myocardin-related transcription factor A isoform X2 [Hypomesus transpacificus]|uniref:myocardin-related transcription factor A isoform X2 n=1 Tax=Hypomesus transpacificus TaxID=137520 RepID=UPI001F08319C|nr:myocardin-related transcription factor A isoform X2 [Hypomesus transpacificus]